MTERTIYLVLDLINDLVHAEGPNGKQPLGEQARARNVLPNTATVLAKARAASVLVGFVRVGFSPDYRECPATSPVFSRARESGLFKLGTWGTEVHETVRPLDGEADIVKHRVSPFYGTSLEPLLRANRIQRIVLSGVSSSAVVQATVREAHDRDYECVVIEDGCSSFSEEDHQSSMTTLSRFARITSADEFDF